MDQSQTTSDVCEKPTIPVVRRPCWKSCCLSDLRPSSPVCAVKCQIKCLDNWGERERKRNAKSATKHQSKFSISRTPVSVRIGSNDGWVCHSFDKPPTGGGPPIGARTGRPATTHSSSVSEARKGKIDGSSGLVSIPNQCNQCIYSLCWCLRIRASALFHLFGLLHSNSADLVILLPQIFPRARTGSRPLTISSPPYPLCFGQLASWGLAHKPPLPVSGVWVNCGRQRSTRRFQLYQGPTPWDHQLVNWAFGEAEQHI